MERVIVIEVSDLHGRVQERFRASHFPVRIGRAYDNDLIIDDPYVCPYHCEVVLDESGEPVVNDLESINGTFVMENGSRDNTITAIGDKTLRIGHTLLRFRDPAHPVEATRRDHHHSRRHAEWPPHSALVSTAILVCAALFMTLMDYLGSYSEFDYGRYFFSKQIPSVIAVAGWAAVWSIVSRVTAHRFAFLRHAVILVTIMMAVYVSDYALDFLKFGFAAEEPFETISTLLSAAAIALLLFWHLRLCSDQKRVRLFGVSSAIAIVFVVLVQINGYLDGKEFSDAPVYPTGLKPPAFQMVKSKPVDDFVARSEQLRKGIAMEIAAQKPQDEARRDTESRSE